GARFRIYPLPLDSGMGRLELGASTYNGKWANGNWYNSWGVDFNYFTGNLQTRGEWLESYRQMPMGQAADNRQGWYVQAGYFLNGIDVPGLPARLDDYIHRFEPLVRYSGINGPPATSRPPPRKVARGLTIGSRRRSFGRTNSTSSCRAREEYSSR